MTNKILVVEDDNFLINAYRLKFENSNFEVRIAEDGEKAMESLKNFTPDIILLDLIMPVMDGFAVLSALKADPKYKLIPVIVTSNLSQNEDIAKAVDMGADGYIIKSDTTIKAIVDKILSLLNKQV